MITLFLSAIPDFHPLIPPLLTIPCVMGITALSIYHYLKTPAANDSLKFGLLALRLCSLGLITVMLLGPQWYDMQAAQDEEVSVHVVVDLSQSMMRPVSASDSRSRTDLWKQEFLPRVKDSQETEFWQWWSLGDHQTNLVPAELNEIHADQSDSPILESMTAMIQSLPGQSQIILISDGADTSDPRLMTPLKQLALSKRIKIHTLRAGESDRSPQLQVQFLANRDLLYEGESTALEVMLQYQSLEKGTWTLELLHNDQKLDSRSFDIENNSGIRSFSFQVSPRLNKNEKRSLHHYQVRVLGSDAETTLPKMAESDTHTFITVTGQRIKTLLLEGRPHWDSRFLARTLAEDPRIDLSTVIAYSQLRQVVKHYQSAETTQDPSNEVSSINDQDLDLSLAALRKYDVILVGRGMERFFPDSQTKQLVDYVSSGGALFLIRGEAFSDDASNNTLNKILPLTWAKEVQQDQNIQGAVNARKLLPDIQGLSLKKLPRLTALYQEQELAPQALIFLDTHKNENNDTQAILIAGPHKQGRVMAWLTSNSWRWAFMSPQHDGLRAVYKNLHHNALRWLAYGDELTPEAELKMSLTPTHADLNETIQVKISSTWQTASELNLNELTLEVMDAEGQHVIEALSLQSSPAEPDQLLAQWSTGQAGIYRMRLTDHRESKAENPDIIEAPFLVSNQSPDHLIHQPNAEFLLELSMPHSLVEQSVSDTSSLLERLNKNREHLKETSLQRSSTTIPWIQWFPLTLMILACFTLEWFVRRRSGLS